MEYSFSWRKKKNFLPRYITSLSFSFSPKRKWMERKSNSVTRYRTRISDDSWFFNLAFWYSISVWLFPREIKKEEEGNFRSTPLNVQMHRVPLFKFFNRESNTFDRFQVAWKFATANKFTSWGFWDWNGVQTVWFNRVKNDCSLWHDTGRGIFWQFLFLATLLFEYKKKSSLNKWISSLEITFLSFFHKRERERERNDTGFSLQKQFD